MKIPFAWLKEFVPVKLSPERLAERLTQSGFEVESLIPVEGEPVLEVNVTPNRGDCLSILGMAREIAGIMSMRMRRLPDCHEDPAWPVRVAPVGGTGGLYPPSCRRSRHEDPALPVRVAPVGGTGGLYPPVIKDRQGCLRYSLAIVQGVKVAPSPPWLVKRLTQVGLRSINNVVDVTNYVMMERGQPLHAFDQQKIRGGKVLIRRAVPGEKILTIDGEERDLRSEDLLIADAEGPIALAGIMGGKDSEVDGATTNIALESAFFDPVTIRRTAKRLGLQTESSYRFERRVDPEGVVEALHRAVSLIVELAGGEATAGWIDPPSKKFPARKIPLKTEEVTRLLGVSWTGKEIESSLKKLNLRMRKQGPGWQVEVPSYRADLLIAPDLIEEVVRVTGLTRLPSTFPALETPSRGTENVRTEGKGREILIQSGFSEVIHFSFLSPQDLQNFDPGQLPRAVPIVNPLGQEDSLLRPTLLPSLLKTVALHHSHKIFDLRLFEFRKIFSRGGGGGVQEQRALAAVLTGSRLSAHWSLPRGETDFYDLKGVVERLLGGLGVDSFRFVKGAVAALHPHQAVRIFLGESEVGILGELHPEVADRFELKRRCYLFELLWEPIAKVLPARKFSPFSRFPIVERDISLVVKEEVTGGELQEAIACIDPQIREVRLFDLYRGAPVMEGRKSLSFSLFIGRSDRTLTDEETNEVYGKVVETVQRRFGATIR